jgi:putative ABC transport system permease protein
LADLIEPVYYVTDRSGNPGYQEYRDNADRISAIAEIFPVFFFLIAALVSFTTMARMVDEQRQQMGTLKGLGYSDFDIAKKYLIYAAIACIVGPHSVWWPVTIFSLRSSLMPTDPCTACLP